MVLRQAAVAITDFSSTVLVPTKRPKRVANVFPSMISYTSSYRTVTKTSTTCTATPWPSSSISRLLVCLKSADFKVHITIPRHITTHLFLTIMLYNHYAPITQQQSQSITTNFLRPLLICACKMGNGKLSLKVLARRPTTALMMMVSREYSQKPFSTERGGHLHRIDI